MEATDRTKKNANPSSLPTKLGRDEQRVIASPKKAKSVPKNRKVDFDDDGIKFLQSPRKKPISPALPNKSKFGGAKPKTLKEQIVLPANESHGQLKLDIIKKIGQGAYGEVYHVRLPSYNQLPDNFPPSNNFALKRMLDPKLNRAFEYEQKIMDEIHKKFPECSAHVLCHFDISKDKNGIYYLLSEMQEGDVRDIKKNLTSDEEKMDIAIQLLDQSLQGLDELKVAGIHHRDIKMDNILYSFAKKSGEIVFKLADFGLSCGENNKAIECGTGIFGSPAYINPKVLLLNFSGKAKDVDKVWDETDDIYSLAVVLYEFLFDDEILTDEAFKVFTEMYKSQKSNSSTKIDRFVALMEERYQDISKKIKQEMKKYKKSDPEYKLYQFILVNTNPFQKKQSISQSQQSI